MNSFAENIVMNYTFQTVAIGSVILGVISGVIGSFAILRKQSLLGDAVSHAALPGIVLAFMLTGTKSMGALLIGAFLTGLIAIFLIYLITNKSAIKLDSSLAFVMSVFFGLGLVLLTKLQKVPNSNQAGLKDFLFGQAAALLKKDIISMSIVGIFIISIVIIFWKELKLLTFDKEYGFTVGFSSNILNILISVMIVTTIVIGLQAVGVVLMSALLISPGAAARQWTNRLEIMVLLSAFFGGISGFSGALICGIFPNIPTGPAIVAVVSVIAFFSLAFAPGRGILWSILYRKKLTKQNNAICVPTEKEKK